jgi:hypothetical protein
MTAHNLSLGKACFSHRPPVVVFRNSASQTPRPG